MVPFDDRITRLPVFRSTAVEGDELSSEATLVVQRIRLPPLLSDITRLEVLVRERIGAEEALLVAGVSRLATHTVVISGMPLYHMARYSLLGVVVLEGLKNPKAKAPPSETIVVPKERGWPGTSRSSDALNVLCCRREGANPSTPSVRVYWANTQSNKYVSL